MEQACDLPEIKLLDHIIVSVDSYFSLSDEEHL
ncbi:JAB domain-containing protein [Cecembia rubra]